MITLCINNIAQTHFEPERFVVGWPTVVYFGSTTVVVVVIIIVKKIMSAFT